MNMMTTLLLVLWMNFLHPRYSESFSPNSLVTLERMSATQTKTNKRNTFQIFLKNDEDEGVAKTNFQQRKEQQDSKKNKVTRRSMLKAVPLITTSMLMKPHPSRAGLVQFPCTYNLMNTYHLMRAGESLLESQDIMSTNPLFLTNRDDALSPYGIEQVEAACIDMMNHDVNPSVLRYSLAAKSIDTANVIASQMQVCASPLIHYFSPFIVFFCIYFLYS